MESSLPPVEPKLDPNNIICKQALTNEEAVQALAEFVLRKDGKDPALLKKAGVAINVKQAGSEEDSTHLVIVYRR